MMEAFEAEYQSKKYDAEEKREAQELLAALNKQKKTSPRNVFEHVVPGPVESTSSPNKKLEEKNVKLVTPKKAQSTSCTVKVPQGQ